MLNTEHFQLVLSKTNKKLLCHGIAQPNKIIISLVLFFTPDCEYCEELKEIFKILSQHIKSHYFCFCNLKLSSQVIQLSKESTTPLQHVPYVLCYVNGKPYAKYEGERSVKSLKDFIQTVNAKVEQFKTSPQLQKDELDEQISTSATPLNKARRCYLTMDEAYSTNTNPNASRKKHGGYQTMQDLYGSSFEGSGMS